VKFKFRDKVKVDDPFYGDYVGFVLNKRETSYHSPNSSNLVIEYLIGLNLFEEKHWIFDYKLIRVEE